MSRSNLSSTPAPSGATNQLNFNPSHDGAAKRIAYLHFRDLRYHVASKQWFVFSEGRWQSGPVSEVERRIVNLKDDYETDHVTSTDGSVERQKFSKLIENQSMVTNIERAARRQPELESLGDPFDNDPWALNVANGTLCLKSLAIRGHDPDDMITRISPVEFDPQATAPEWTRFIEWFSNGDHELQFFMQEVFGTTLVGQNLDRILIFLLGVGSNGKSVLLQVLRHILGDYGQDAPSDLLVTKSSGGASPELAQMKGIRLLCLDDPTINDQNTAVDNLKRLSGDQMITGRPLYGEFIEFRGQMNPVIAVNRIPDLSRGGGEAIWDRLQPIACRARIQNTKKDPELLNKLISESPGILNWLLEGLKRRLDRGHLSEPNAVTDLRAKIRQEKDSAQIFVENCVEPSPTNKISATVLYGAYQTFCKSANLDSLDRARLKHCMETAGFEQKKHSSIFWMKAKLVCPANDNNEGVS